MTKLDFDSPENREKSLADLKSLLDNPGWVLVKEIADKNIERLKALILDGIGNDETLDSVKRLRDRLKAYQDIIGTPEWMIKKLQPVKEVTHNEDDPFPFVEEDDKVDVK